jgi:cytochrome P450/NADPH-cytochrome P450 reductase
MSKKSLVVRFEQRAATVAWYPGTGDAALERAIRQALALSDAVPLVLRDADGDVVALSDSLPSGLTLEVGGAAPAAPPALVEPSGPTPYPIVGNMPDFLAGDGTVLDRVSRLTRQYGDFVRLKMPGRFIFLCSDADVVTEMRARPEEFQKTIPERSPLGNLRHTVGDALFTSAESEVAWQSAHRVLLPAFGMSALKQYYPRLLDVADDLFAHLDKLPPQQPFLATDVMTRMTFEAISYAGFNTRFNSLQRPEVPPFVEAMSAVLTDAMASPGQFLPPVFRPIATKRRHQADATLRDTVDQLIVARRAAMAQGEPVPADMLQLMLTSRDKVTGEVLPDDNIRHQLITFLVAGHETTSGMLSYALYYLAQNPAAEARLIEEADRVLGRDYSHRPSFHDVDRLDYTLRVLKEALRLQPTAPAFQKTAMKDTVLCGKYAIPKGSDVLVFLPALHRNPRFWGANPEVFDPDRFSPEAVEARQPDAFHPFGLGVRSCIGFQFALIEARMVLARFYQRYRVSLSDPGYTLQHVQSLTVKPRDLQMVLEKRPEERGRFPAAEVVQAPDAATTVNAGGLPMLVLYGSNMGTSRDQAEQLARTAQATGLSPTVAELDAYVGKLPTDRPVVIVTSTYNGLPPDNAVRFHAWLGDTTLRRDLLKGVRFAVLGCGNKQWRTTFQKFPVFLADRLTALGATSFHEAGACDADGDFDAVAESWSKNLWPKLRQAFNLGQVEASVAEDEVLYDLEVVNFAGTQPNAAPTTASPLHEAARRATVRKNDELQMNAADRSTRHIELTLPPGATYRAGDHLGVFPENPADVVEAVAKRCGARLSDVLVLRQRGGNTESGLPCGVPISVQELLTAHVDLLGPLSRKELRALARACPCPPEEKKLAALASEASFKGEVIDSRLHLLDVLKRFESIELKLALLLSIRPTLKPRYYSISSSPRVLPTACSLTVGVHTVSSPDGRVHEGLCSHYLARCPAGTEVKVAIKDTRSTFRLPDDLTKDVLLIGPGTGIAPMRGFIQERAALRQSGEKVGKTLLFFGCRRADQDFLYERELAAFVESGALTVLHTAFSREPGKPKKYVQDCIREQAALIADHIAGGGYVYVCGDARNMAPDVERTIAGILAAREKLSVEDGAKRVALLKTQGRYLEDVWAAS